MPAIVEGQQEHQGIKYWYYAGESAVKVQDKKVIEGMVAEYARFLDESEKYGDDKYYKGKADGMSLALTMLGVQILHIWFKDNWSGDIHYFPDIIDAKQAAKKEAGIVYIYGPGDLDFKKKQNLKSFYHIECYINKASDFFGDRNVKTIKKKDIRDFLEILNVADKTRSNYCSQLHDMFYSFLYEEIEVLTLAPLPKFPKIDFELGFRKIIGVRDREVLIEDLRVIMKSCV